MKNGLTWAYIIAVMLAFAAGLTVMLWWIITEAITP